MAALTEVTLPAKWEELVECGLEGINSFGLEVTQGAYALADVSTVIDDLAARVQKKNFRLEPVQHQQIFDVVNGFETLTADNKLVVVEGFMEVSELVLDNLNPRLTNEEKVSSKLLLFYFMQVCLKAEGDAKSVPVDITVKKTKSKVSKKKSAGGQYEWQFMRLKYLQCIEQVVKAELGALWPLGMVEECFIKSVWSYALTLLDARPAGLAGAGSDENSARNLCVSIVASSIRHFGSVSTSGSYAALTTMILDCLLRSEHMINPTCEICHKEKIVTNSNHIGNEIFIELREMNGGNLTPQGVKNIAGFIDAYSKIEPEEFSTYIPTLIRQVDSSAHQIRSAMTMAIGNVVSFVYARTNHVTTADSAATMQDDQDHKSKATLIRLRDSLLNILVERTHDINPFSRAALLKVWTALIDSHAVPVKRFGNVADVAVDRLFDKNALVRKNAILLMATIVENNPFTHNLDLEVYEAQKIELQGLIEDRLLELSESLHQIEQQTKAQEEGKAIKKDSSDDLSDHDEEEEEEGINEDELFADADVDERVCELRLKLDYISSAVTFMYALDKAVPRIVEMLESKNTTDIVEGLSFLGKAVQFHVKGAMKLVESAFKLIWHSEPGVRKELEGVFAEIYLNSHSSEGSSAHASSAHPRYNAKEIAIQLTKLISSNSNSIISMEEIVIRVFTGKDIANDIVVELRHLATSALEYGNYLIVASAYRVLCMLVSSVDVDTLHMVAAFASRLGLSPKVINHHEYGIVKMTAMLYNRITDCLMKSKHEVNVDVIEDCIAGYQTVLMEILSVTEHSISGWYEAAEEIIHGIFKLHPNPDEVIEAVVMSLHRQLFNGNQHCGSLHLAGFLFILGQAAVTTVVYVENLANKVKTQLKDDAERGEKQSSSGNNASNKAGAENNLADFEEQMGVLAAVEADHDQEVHQLIEKELVLTNLLGSFLPLATFIVANDNGQFSEKTLRKTAVLTLCRFMTISSVSCEQSLPLLFTVLDRELQSATLRTTIVVALGDLAFRFPNTFEPWTDRLYARLKDSDVEVRYNTMVVVTHLVLNDMIKVKGQVSHVAMALNDSEECIRDLARLFFIKLSERSNNPVFNLLGDIISNLSREDTEVILTEEQFQSTMHFMLSFVQKEKHADSLLERLLIRIGAAETVLQRRNLAFCVSELTVTEKGLKKMIEAVKTIKFALTDDVVFEHFRTLLSRTKKSRAPASSSGATAAEGGSEGAPVITSSVTKATVEEAEKVLYAAVAGEDGHGIKLGGEGAGDEQSRVDGDDAPTSQSTVKKPRAAAATSRRGAKKPAAADSSKPARKAPARKRAVTKKVVESDEDNDNAATEDELDDDESENMPQVKNKQSVTKSAAATSSRPARKASRQIVMGDENEE